MTPTRPTRVEQIRALTPAFFARFFETEITAGSTDLRASIFYLIAFLAAPGVAAPILIGLFSSHLTSGPAGWGWNMVATQLGVEALRTLSLGDKTLYVGCAMAASGLISAVVWNSLLTDRRDALVLGTLPVGAPTIVAAKLVALSGFIAMVVVGMHALASCSFGLFLGSANTFTFIGRGIVAHFVASCAASAFVLFVVASIQGTTLAVLGPRLFERVAPVLQLALVALTVVGLCLLPRLSHSATSILTTRAAGDPQVMALVPLWFVGLYESVLGTKSILLHQMATLGLTAIAVAVSVTVVTYAIAYRRLMTAAVETEGRGRMRLDVPRLVTALVARNPEVQAVVHFFLSALTRLERQRFVIASALGAGLAWGLPGWLVVASGTSRSPVATVLAVPFSVMLASLVGLRVAATLPADPRASWVFDFSLASWRTTRLALERTLFVLGVAPVTAIAAACYAYWWGWPAALTHIAFGTATGWLMVQLMLRGFRGMPCADPWTPNAASLRAMWPVYLGFFLGVTAGLPSLETVLMSHAVAAATLSTLFGLVALLLRHMLLARGPNTRTDQTSIVEGVPIEWQHRAAPDGEETTNARPVREVWGRSSSQLFARAHSKPWLEALIQLTHDLKPEAIDVRGELRSLRHDVVMAARRLRRRPGFTVFSVITIAFGVAATATVYAVAYAALLKPPAINDIDRVVNIYSSTPTHGSFAVVSMSSADVRDLRAMQTSYSHLTAWTPAREVIAANGSSTLAMIEAVDGEFFTVIGNAPALGRTIQAQDDVPGSEPVIVLSHALWTRTFGSDVSVVGKMVRVGSRPFRVIGVASPAFTGVAMPTVQPTAAWIPLTTWTARRGARDPDDRRDHWLMVKGRLSPGTMVEASATDVRRIALKLDIDYPLDQDPRYRRWWEVVPAADIHAHETVSTIAIPLATLLMLSVGLVLLVTCTNLANLTMAWGAARRQDLAIRLALGASRRQLVQGQVIESAIVATAGGLAAVLLTRWVLSTIASGPTLRLGPLLSAQVTPSLSSTVWTLLPAVAVTVGVFGAWPAWRLSRVALREVLAGTSRTVAGAGWRGRQAIIAAQVAVSVVLLGTAALFLGQLAEHGVRETGMDLDRLAVVQLAFPDDAETSVPANLSIARMLDAVRRRTDIESAAAVSGLPIGGTGGSGRVRRPDAPGFASVTTIAATASVFDTLGVRLLQGRAMSDVSDVREAVVSERTARDLFGTANAIGHTVPLMVWRSGAEIEIPMTVVGIAADTDVGSAGTRDRDIVYVPLDEREPQRAAIVARVSRDPGTTAATLAAMILQTERDVAVAEATTGAIAAGVDSPGAALLAWLAGVLGMVALGLATVGLFGVLSQQVSDRGHELGVRAALGARPGDIVRLVVRDGVRPVIEGLVAGAAVGVLVRYSLPAALGRLVPATHWPMLAAVPLLLVGAAIAASYLPARRATATDPIVALRSQ